MLVRDLMVGDWVYNKHHKRNIQITPYDFFNHGHDEQGRQYVNRNNAKVVTGNDFEPIELTEEILVKNGFEKQGDLYQYHIEAGDGYTRIDLIDLQDGAWSYDIDIYNKFSDAHEIHHNDDCYMKLHQLQHLLRLCGIEKELVID